jgi:hypothetical protein
MKAKVFFIALVSMLSFATANAKTTDKTRIIITSHASKEDAARARVLQNKLDSIQALDISSLSKADKEKVKTELEGIKKETKKMEGVYIYLGGGVLLVILLLIILL